MGVFQLPEKYPIVARIMYISKKLPLWKVMKWTPIRSDYAVTLPKDKIVEINHKLDAPESIVLPSQIVEYFINKASHIFRMGFCVCRYSHNCKKYPINYGCLLLGDAVTKINPKFGRLVGKEEALEYARKCREIGLVHLIGKAYPDRLGLGAGPANKLETLCNCCECCCLLGTFKYMPPQISHVHQKMPGVEVKVTDKCVGCGTCTRGVCFIKAIQVVNKRAVIGEDCKGCGRCALICPNHAIELTIKDNDYIRNTIQKISQYVDVT